MRILAPLALAVTLLAACSHDADDAPEPGWTRLANGLRVCIRPIEGAKDVAVMTTFDIGSYHDPAGQSGLAHLVEHLYVTAAAGATAARTVEEWQTRYGDRCAAITRANLTSIHVVVSPDALEAEIVDAAARMSELRIEQADLARERPRVLQQIEDVRPAPTDSIDDQAVRIAFEHACPSPDSRSIAGSRADVTNLSLDTIRDRCSRLYRPVNARLVITGAVDPAVMMPLVVKNFAALASGERRPAPDAAAPATPGTYEVDTGAIARDGFVKRTAVCVAYPCPRPTDDDYAAALYFSIRALTAQRSPEFFVLPSPDGRALAIRSFGAERPPAEFVARIDDIVKRFAESAPDPAEIAAARSSFDRFLAAGQETSDGLAARLASAAIDRVVPERVAESIERLTQADLARYAAKWLMPERRVIAIVHGVAQLRATAPSPSTPAPVPAPDDRPRLPRLDIISEIRIDLDWDEATQTTHRRMDGREFVEDAELEKAITAARDAWTKQGKPDVPATIDGDSRVPWTDVIALVNVIKRCGIDKIEFAMGAPPKTPK